MAKINKQIIKKFTTKVKYAYIYIKRRTEKKSGERKNQDERLRQRKAGTYVRLERRFSLTLLLCSGLFFLLLSNWWGPLYSTHVDPTCLRFVYGSRFCFGWYGEREMKKTRQVGPQFTDSLSVSQCDPHESVTLFIIFHK